MLLWRAKGEFWHVSILSWASLLLTWEWKHFQHPEHLLGLPSLFKSLLQFLCKRIFVLTTHISVSTIIAKEKEKIAIIVIVTIIKKITMSCIFQSIKTDFSLLFLSSLLFCSGFLSIFFLFHESTIPFIPFSSNFFASFCSGLVTLSLAIYLLFLIFVSHTKRNNFLVLLEPCKDHCSSHMQRCIKTLMITKPELMSSWICWLPADFLNWINVHFNITINHILIILCRSEPLPSWIHRKSTEPRRSMEKEKERQKSYNYTKIL